MERIWQEHRLAIIAVAVLIVGVLMSLYIVPEEDGTLWLRDARFSDPRATGRFEVRLPSDICDGVKTEPSGGNGG